MWNERGIISLRSFWLQRARRLLPAVFLMIGATRAFALVFLPHEVAGLRSDALAALAYVTNWYLVLTRPQLDVPFDGWALLVLRLAATGILAALSYRFVETPIRKGMLERRLEGPVRGVQASALGDCAAVGRSGRNCPGWRCDAWRVGGDSPAAATAGLPGGGIHPHRVVVRVFCCAHTGGAGAPWRR